MSIEFILAFRFSKAKTSVALTQKNLHQTKYYPNHGNSKARGKVPPAPACDPRSLGLNDFDLEGLQVRAGPDPVIFLNTIPPN